VKNARNVLTTILKLAVAGGLIWWLVQRGSLNFGLLADLAKQPTFLFSAITASFINICLNNYRWGILLRGQGFPVGVRETLPLTLIGLFFNYAMPGGVGGDLVKGFYLMQDHPERRTAAATSVLIDRLLGVAGMVVMSLTAVAFNLDVVRARPQLTSLAIALAALFLGFAAFFALAFSRRIRKHDFVENLLSRIPGGRAIRLVYDAVHSYRRALPSFWAACAITLISQSFSLVFFMLIGTAMGFTDVPLKAYVFAVPLGLIATALPISPAGVGVGQVAFSYLFDWSTGVRTAIGSNLITAHQLVTFLLSLSGGVFYFRRRKPAMTAGPADAN
jgi:uncharacterized protein (TIRG00374 family)